MTKSSSEASPLHPPDNRDDELSNKSKANKMGPLEFFAILISMILVIVTFPISWYWCFKVVQEYERAVIFRLGRLRTPRPQGPGIFFIIPYIDKYRKIDLRTISLIVSTEGVLTKDSVTVTVDTVLYYMIEDPLSACVKVADYIGSTRLLAVTSLRNILGTMNLAEILSDRDTISRHVQSTLYEATQPWGIKVERVEMKDINLPHEMKRAMAAEAEAAEEAKGKIVAAEGEIKASKALKQASDIIGQSPAALQLRYLQTLGSIATNNNSSTIVFPLPMDILTAFLPKSDELKAKLS